MEALQGEIAFSDSIYGKKIEMALLVPTKSLLKTSPDAAMLFALFGCPDVAMVFAPLMPTCRS